MLTPVSKFFTPFSCQQEVVLDDKSLEDACYRVNNN